MATSEENDLIGYDPLAWMENDNDQDEDQDQDHLVMDDIDSDNKIRMNEDYSDDLKVGAQENAILNTAEDESAINAFKEETDAVLITESASDPVSAEMEESLIDLDATLTIQNVVKLYEKLKKSLALHDQIEINASDVSSIDTATLQLLVSLKKDAGKLHKKVTIIYPSPRFVESAKLLGLLDVLDIHGL